MKCIVCGEKDPDRFYPNNNSRCKACNIKRTVELYHPRRREKQAAYYRQWYAAHGRKRSENYQDVIMLWNSTHQDSIRARIAVAEAIRQGLLERPLECIICGRQGRINGHHENYDFPYDVTWLCSSCHKKVHLGIIGVDK